MTSDITRRAKVVEATIDDIREHYGKQGFKVPSDVWLTLALESMKDPVELMRLTRTEAADFVSRAIHELLLQYNEDHTQPR